MTIKVFARFLFIFTLAMVILLLSGCDNIIIKSLLPPPASSAPSSDINSGKNITLEVLDAYKNPLRNAWFKEYCTNQNGIVTFPYNSLDGENSIELKVYNPNGEVKSHSGVIDTTVELSESPIKIVTNLVAITNDNLLPRIKIHVKSLNADNIYVQCYSQNQNRPQTDGFICNERVVGKCLFNDLPFHEGYADQDGVFYIPCVQMGEYFVDVTLIKGGVKSSQYFSFSVDTLTGETVFVADTRGVATGYSLGQLGYTTDFSSVRVRDINNPYKKNAVIEAVDSTVIATQNSDTILKGSFSTVKATLFNKDKHETSDISIMTLQGFKKSELKTNKYIEIGELLYTVADLEKYKIFEDNNNCIYDLRFPSTQIVYSQYLTQLDESVDMQALNNLYFRLNKSEFIKAIPPLTNVNINKSTEN